MSGPASDPTVRATGIGGSDAAALCGQSRWADAMDKYLEKTGQSAPILETERMYWGTQLEDVVAREWSKRTGMKVRRRSITMRDKSAPWRMAHIDREVVGLPDGRREGLECKTADRFAADEFGEEGSDQVPPEYLLQCQHYLGVTGWDAWHLAVLIGGNRFRLYSIPRDDALIADLFAIEDDFWLNHVVPRVPPPVNGGEGSRRLLESRHTAPEESVPMTDELYDLALAYQSLSLRIKEAESARDVTGNQIRELMGAAGKSARDNARIGWSVVKASRIDTRRLAEEEPAVAAKYTVESEQHRLTVSVKESR